MMYPLGHSWPQAWVVLQGCLTYHTTRVEEWGVFHNTLRASMELAI